MISIVLSANGYRQYPDPALQLIFHAVENAKSRNVVIDCLDVASTASQPSLGNLIAENIHRLSIVECLLDGQPNAHAIGLLANSVPATQIVLLDATAYPVDLVSSVLELVRQAWFHLDKWHPAFVVICDDYQLLHFAKELNGSFHIQPKTLTEEEVQLCVRSIRFRALAIRWLGEGRLSQILRRIYRISSRTRTKAI